MKRILPTSTKASGICQRNAESPAELVLRNLFLKMLLYLEAALPITRELFLNAVHTSADCYAIKKKKDK